MIVANPPSLPTAFAWVAKLAEQASRNPAPTTSNNDTFLPRFKDAMRAMPNHLARSSLFAPIPRCARVMHNRRALISRTDAVLEYTGQQLDESDADLMMHLIFLAKKEPLGRPIRVTRYQILHSLGKSKGKSDYLWLHDRMRALTEATLYLEVKRRDGTLKYKVGGAMAFHLIQTYEFNDTSDAYMLTLDPRWVTLFSNSEFALIDWKKRRKIRRGQDMAKAIQRLVATSSDREQRYELKWLKDKLEYRSPPNKFGKALVLAVKELEQVGVLSNSKIAADANGTPQVIFYLGDRT